MRLLLDINVLLDIAFQRPGEPASAALIALCGRRHDAWLAWHSVANLAYLIEREQSPADARRFIRGMLGWAEVAVTQRSDALAALDWPMNDFEDALQAAAALSCGAQAIITRNGPDFRNSPVATMTPEAFLTRYPVAD
jgi:predicted nucleic acid-binding protein